jgi:hypothetical protein
MIAGSAEEDSLSSKRSWNPKAASSFIYLNAGSAATGFGVNRRPDARHLPPEWHIHAGSDPFAERYATLEAVL